MSYWSKLSMKDRANVMKLFLDKGISDLDTIRKEYNIFAEGGSIHIDPSKKGTFTAAASRHGMGVQEFASKVLANKENYSPAMVKKANFARNASKWHGFGGNLYGDGGSYSYTKPLDNVYVDSEGNLLDPNVPSARGSIRIPDVEVTANPIDVGRGKAARLYNDYGIASNDATSTPLTRNIHLNERGLDGATKAAAWMKDNPTLNNVGMALGAVPFAVAGYPAFMAAGEGTATALANPYVDAALTAGFGAHGLNHAVNEGINGWGDAAMTALELAPLGRLAKPMWNAGKEGLQYAAKVTDNTARYVSPSYDLYRTIGETKPKYTRVPSKNLFRTYVYKGGEITDPHSNFVTTDLQYAANYGKVTPYIFESKSIAKAKEPMMGYKDPVNMDMFIYNNTKRNPNATAIIGHDAVTGEFAPSKGVEILNMSPKNLYPVKTSKPSTIEWVDATRTPQITAENAAKNSSIMADANDFSYKGLTSDMSDFFEKMTYSNKIHGKPMVPSDEGVGGFSKSVQVGIPKTEYDELLHDVIGRNIREFKQAGLSDAQVSNYINNAKDAMDNVHIGMYSDSDYIKGGWEGFGGFYDSEGNFISVNTGSPLPKTKVVKHEGRHLLDHKVDDEILMPASENFGKDFDSDIALSTMQKVKQNQNMTLYDAYDNDFMTLPSKEGFNEGLEGYSNMDREAITTNLDSRNELLGSKAGWDLDITDKIIDKMPDTAIFDAVEKANGYGRRYIRFLRENNKLTPEKAKQFREAMKHVGAIATPVGIGYGLSQGNE